MTTTPFDQYPAWARRLAHGIRARLGNTFVLHGNTHDLQPAPHQADRAHTAADFVPLTAFLARWVFGQRDVIVEYQRANGPVFHTRAPDSSHSTHTSGNSDSTSVRRAAVSAATV